MVVRHTCSEMATTQLVAPPTLKSVRLAPELHSYDYLARLGTDHYFVVVFLLLYSRPVTFERC